MENGLAVFDLISPKADKTSFCPLSHSSGRIFRCPKKDFAPKPDNSDFRPLSLGSQILDRRGCQKELQAKPDNQHFRPLLISVASNNVS